jgi:hypothetical protein
MPSKHRINCLDTQRLSLTQPRDQWSTSCDPLAVRGSGPVQAAMWLQGLGPTRAILMPLLFVMGLATRAS